MKGKTYYRYIWLLDLLLTNGPLTFDDICKMWEMNPMCEGPLALRTFHEHHKGIKEMFGVDIGCNRKKNTYFVKNPEALDENRLAQWLLRKYSIPQDFVTFNKMKDRILLDTRDCPPHPSAQQRQRPRHARPLHRQRDGSQDHGRVLCHRV